MHAVEEACLWKTRIIEITRNSFLFILFHFILYFNITHRCIAFLHLPRSCMPLCTSNIEYIKCRVNEAEIFLRDLIDSFICSFLYLYTYPVICFYFDIDSPRYHDHLSPSFCFNVIILLYFVTLVRL